MALIPRISAQYVVPPGPEFSTHNALARAGSDGAFQAADLPSGVYDMCVSSPGSDLVGDCDWAVRPNGIIVRPGRTETANASLKRGQWLNIRIAGPDGHIAKARQQTVGVEISAPGLAPRALLSPVRQGTGLVYTVLVPDDVDLDVRVRAKWLKMADSAGKALDTRAGVRLKHRAAVGIRTRDISLRVSGVITNADLRSVR